MSNLLKDLLPDAPRETSVLVAAAEAGLAQALLDHVKQGMDVATASSLSASAFAARTPFTPEACSWVVNELSVALSLSPADTPQTGPAQAGQGAGEAARQGLPPAGQGRPGGKAETLPAQDATAGTGWAVGTGAGAGAGSGAGYGSPSGAGAAPGAGYGPPPGTGYGSPPGAGAAPGAGYGPPPGTGYGSPPGAGYGSPPAGYGAPPGVGAVPGAGAPGAPAGAGPLTGPGGAEMPKQRPKKWMILTGAVAVLAVIGVIVALTQNKPSPQTTLESVSKIISQFTSSCQRAGHFGMHGVTNSQFCKAKANPSDIGIYAFQFDSTRDYQAGLVSLNRGYGFNPSSADGSCPPAAGSSTGAVPWFSKVDRTYKERTGQTLECYTYVRYNVPEYLWTLPTKRVILIADDHKSGATLKDLDNWWTTLTYR